MILPTSLLDSNCCMLRSTTTLLVLLVHVCLHACMHVCAQKRLTIVYYSSGGEREREVNLFLAGLAGVASSLSQLAHRLASSALYGWV